MIIITTHAIAHSVGKSNDISIIDHPLLFFILLSNQFQYLILLSHQFQYLKHTFI